MDSFRDVSSPANFSPSDVDARSRTTFLGSADETPFDVRDVDSRPGSRPASPTPGAKPNGNLGGTSVTEVRPTGTSAGPEAKITFDIRAHSAEQKSSHQQLSKFQNTMSSQLEAAEKAWKAEPRYNFTQRATLYKAYIQAQAKFNTLNAFIHLEQAHVNYLDALGRSSFSPDKQHAMYSTFQEAMKKAGADRCFLNTFDVNYSGKSTTLVEAATRNATQSQQLVQKLLKDIQKPHTELRNNVAQNLRYREVQLHHLSASSDEAARLKADMSDIRAFQAVGGLDIH